MDLEVIGCHDTDWIQTAIMGRVSDCCVHVYRLEMNRMSSYLLKDSKIKACVHLGPLVRTRLGGIDGNANILGMCVYQVS
jgi:hypothetical protein